jgi:hypothetical protein
MATNKAALFRNLALIFLACILAGCGVKASPKPYVSQVPAAVKDLSAGLQNDLVVLSWTAPAVSEDKTPLTELAGFIVYRAEISEPPPCPACPVSWEVLREIIARKDQAGQRIQFEDSSQDPGKRYIYKVKARNFWGDLSGDSNSARFPSQ